MAASRFTNPDLGGVDDDTLIRELRKRGRLQEVGGQRALARDDYRSKEEQSRAEAILERDVAREIGIFLLQAGAFDRVDHKDEVSGNKFLTLRGWVLHPAKPVTEKEPA